MSFFCVKNIYKIYFYISHQSAQCFKFLIVLTTWKDPKIKIGSLKFGTFQGYCHMAELLVKTAYTIFYVKVVLK